MSQADATATPSGNGTSPSLHGPQE